MSMQGDVDFSLQLLAFTTRICGANMCGAIFRHFRLLKKRKEQKDMYHSVTYYFFDLLIFGRVTDCFKT